MRIILGTIAALSICAASLLTAGAETKDSKDKKDAKPASKAHIVKVDAKAGTITVKMKDPDSKDGKEVEKTFKLTGEIRYFDSTGKAIAIDEFQSGNDILVLEEDGKLKEVRKDKKTSDTEKK